MADSDGEYVRSASDDDDPGLLSHIARAGAAANAASSSYGTRAKGKGKGKERVEKSWEGKRKNDELKVGPDGRITAGVEEMLEERKRKRLRQDTQPYQRGIIRHVVLILDFSEAMLEKDFRPSRYSVMLGYAVQYIREFFEQNPISQMSIMCMHDGLCKQLSELSGNPNDHIVAVQNANARVGSLERAIEPKGNPSLQNALEMARGALHHTPSHGTREVVIVLGALLTLDPGDIHATIRSCVKDKLRVGIIGLAARLKICQEIVSKTNSADASGYGVALDQQHMQELLMATTTPPVIRSDQTAKEAESNKATLLMMGFPSRVVEAEPSLCACHGQLTRGGYSCSRCQAKICNLPATCPCCKLTLILSTHLARSYHHLFPLQNWRVVSWRRARAKGTTRCMACLSAFPPIPNPIPKPSSKSNHVVPANGANSTNREGEPKDRASDKPTPLTSQAKSHAIGKYQSASESSRYECDTCQNHFCIDCDLFCHEVVHNCPGCNSTKELPPPRGEEDTEVSDDDQSASSNSSKKRREEEQMGGDDDDNGEPAAKRPRGEIGQDQTA
ncbi:Ssl1-domain-containing protein [Aulographum hederae CBS 113979]|uniref:Ssl1-domain-containing protein n=1 Tax=Aulographum hederae CBS 113979 TaxID=1176131 RepID=A0A6G1GMY6_9PEZI|nr:Ssl1-domain-containing protein [Aulographum hederae CBS 113979]